MESSENVAAEDSATLSNDGGATTFTDNYIEDSREEEAVELPPTRAQQPPTQPEVSPFQEGELVLAYHNQLIYKAKIIKVALILNAWRYTVHYPGWKKSWDEVVGIDRLMKYTEENKQKQQEHNQKLEMEINAKPGSKPKGARGKKRKSGSVEKEKAMPSTDKRVNIHIPPALKKLLIHDWECVTHLGELVKLPCSPNVDEILSKYHDYRLKKDDRLAGSVGEIVNGLHRYFDKALPAMLLYQNERQQYKEAITDNVTPSAVYGAEHLLRLFGMRQDKAVYAGSSDIRHIPVKLPEILYNADIEETMLIKLQQNLVDFVKFLQKNQNSFFLGYQQSAEISDSTIKKQE